MAIDINDFYTKNYQLKDYYGMLGIQFNASYPKTSFLLWILA